eukprot:4861694-Amphidinium_carterae.1
MSGSTNGSLELTAFGQGSKSVEVVTEQGMVVVLRGDILQRRHTVQWGSMYSLCAFALSDQTARWTPTTPVANELYAWTEQRLETLKTDQRGVDLLPAKWRSWKDHVFSQGKLHQCSVRGFSIRGNPSWDPEGFWAACSQGTDVATVIPLKRFDVHAYYDPDVDTEFWRREHEAGNFM